MRVIGNSDNDPQFLRGLITRKYSCAIIALRRLIFLLPCAVIRIYIIATHTKMTETNPLSNPAPADAEKLLNIPMEILLMIFEQLDRRQLVLNIKAFHKHASLLSRGTTQKVLDEAEEKAGPEPISQEAWKNYKQKVQNNISEKAHNKAAVEPVYKAMVEAVMAKINKEYPGLYEMLDILSCRQAIPQLREIRLGFFSGYESSLFEEIRQINPDIKWNFGDGFRDCLSGLKGVSDLDILDGLNGSLVVPLHDPEELDSLDMVCKRCHPSFEVKLSIYNGDDMIQRLVNCSSVLARMKTLSIMYPTSYVETEPLTENECRALDHICKSHEFDLVLAGHICLHPCAYTHIAERLGVVKLSFPTRDGISQLKQYTNRDVLREMRLHIPDAEIMSDLVRYRYPLKYLEIENPLKDNAEVSIFRKLYRAHPRMIFYIRLSNLGLLPLLLQDMPNDIEVFLFSGTAYVNRDPEIIKDYTIRCDRHILDHLPDLNLSSLKRLKLYISGSFELDNKLVTTLLEACPNLRELTIKDDYQESPVDDFASLLQREVTEKCKGLQKLTTADDEVFSRINLPGFDQETSSDKLIWHRKGEI